jgi:hypothetical protein
MRFNCIARGEICSVDVDLQGNNVTVTIYSGGADKTLLDTHKMHVDFSHAKPSSTETEERAARIALGQYHASIREGQTPFGNGFYSGVLTGI